MTSKESSVERNIQSKHQIFKYDNEMTLPLHISVGVSETFLVGKRFRIFIAVFKAYFHKHKGSVVRLIMQRTISNNVQFLLSATPLYDGVIGGVSCDIIPQFL